MLASILLNFGVCGVTFLSILGLLELFGAPLAAKAGFGTTLGALWEGIGEDLGSLWGHVWRRFFDVVSMQLFRSHFIAHFNDLP